MLQYKNIKNGIFSFGSISFASFVIAAATGVILAVPYDVKNPYDSISVILLTNPSAAIIRNLHYWSAQLFLITSLLHLWDHLKDSSERRVKNGVWLRLSVSLLIIFFVMLSGFILKGDGESLQAREIFRSLASSIPFAGKSIAAFLSGTGGDLQVIYIQHAAVSTILLWLFISEHARTFWPKIISILTILLLLIPVSLVLSPSLHTNSGTVVKGPWYFQGFQEIFHWMSSPQLVLIFIAILFAAFYFMPRMGVKVSFRAKYVFLILAIAYFILCLFAMFFRGGDWKFVLPWEEEISTGMNLRYGMIPDLFEEKSFTEIPVVLGRREGCIVCHNNMQGLSASHDPKATGCFACHAGNPFTLDKEAAHRGMILIPGNLETAKISCGGQGCHPDIPGRVDNSIMNTMSGVISVDKFVFNEINSPDGIYRIGDIGNSAAESHLRNLCASCHTGGTKDAYGPIDQLSRGGGCNACHLQYSPEALDEMNKYVSAKAGGKAENMKLIFHPSLTVKAANDHCFGCHSRSGRISLNYEGWKETSLAEDDYMNRSLREKMNLRLLQDGRVLEKTIADIHYEKGMLCIDCHTAKEVMGDGNTYSHKEDQVKITCTDCHADKFNRSEDKMIDPEAEKLLKLRNFPKIDKAKLVYSGSGNFPLYNIITDSTGKAFLVLKNSGRILPLKPPAKVCTAGKGHKRLSCNTCHAAWAPQCIDCHTEYNPEKEGFDLLANRDIKGIWEEKTGDIFAEPPVLGIRTITDKFGKKAEIADNFIPGMILSINKVKFPKGRAKGTMFRRFYAPAFPHTVVKATRTCNSCHADPLVLGYGRGELNYEIKNGMGKWIFKPRYKQRKEDSLSADAWTGFLQGRSGIASTRVGARPFTVEEQKKILSAGACLKCHKPESFQIQMYLMNGRYTTLNKKCIIPRW